MNEFKLLESGKVKLSLGDYKGAISDFTKAIKIKPDFAEAYYSRGIAIITLIDLMKNPF